MTQNLTTPTIHMGLPSPSTDFIQFTLDLNSYLIKNPTATFFLKLNTNALARFGFYNEDILVVDKSKYNPKKPQVYEHQGNFKIFYPPKTPDADAVFWGTITGLVREI